LKVHASFEQKNLGGFTRDNLLMIPKTL
jgi:hypothetical protein